MRAQVHEVCNFQGSEFSAHLQGSGVHAQAQLVRHLECVCGVVHPPCPCARQQHAARRTPQPSLCLYQRLQVGVWTPDCPSGREDNKISMGAGQTAGASEGRTVVF